MFKQFWAEVYIYVLQLFHAILVPNVLVVLISPVWQITVNLHTVKRKDSVFTDKFVLKMSPKKDAFVRLLSISLNLYLTVNRPFSYHLSP